ncbi:RWP-RK domain containing hypothetical protein [Phytophthora palmivora]|uniref:RWP-RK domain-containing protein n=1 Tax=Phytophthora palmivora TaxID=4796 RepID=A0A2P4XID5_9STRA|nr:RWP-RK domain containing hypothetical protein [Phytophthora palmivora]
MLQPHFERPLQHAADNFGVCTTLLKKICRRNGISNWPYRKICGLRKSIASMAKQVNYFDGEQKRAYADQLEKLEQELQAYLRTGNEPTEEFLQTFHAEAAEKLKKQSDGHTAKLGNENEEKEAQVVPTWTTRPSIAPPPSAFPTIATHHRALPSISSILQHQSYSSPSRAASTQNLAQYEARQQQQPHWRYFPPSNDDAV